MKTNIAIPASWSRKLLWQLLLLATLCVVLIAFGAAYLPQGIDWHKTYRPAAPALLGGQSPFAEGR